MPQVQPQRNNISQVLIIWTDAEAPPQLLSTLHISKSSLHNLAWLVVISQAEPERLTSQCDFFKNVKAGQSVRCQMKTTNYLATNHLRCRLAWRLAKSCFFLLNFNNVIFCFKSRVCRKTMICIFFKKTLYHSVIIHALWMRDKYLATWCCCTEWE